MPPHTPDLAELKPELATASWAVPTDDRWFTSRYAELSIPPPPSSPPTLELFAVCVPVTPPLLSCLTVVPAVLPAVAFPDVADAVDVPVLVPLLSFFAVPPVLPAVLFPVWSLPPVALPS